jgi:hypothetical protein
MRSNPNSNTTNTTIPPGSSAPATSAPSDSQHGSTPGNQQPISSSTTSPPSSSQSQSHSKIEEHPFNFHSKALPSKPSFSSLSGNSNGEPSNSTTDAVIAGVVVLVLVVLFAAGYFFYRKRKQILAEKKVGNSNRFAKSWDDRTWQKDNRFTRTSEKTSSFFYENALHYNSTYFPKHPDHTSVFVFGNPGIEAQDVSSWPPTPSEPRHPNRLHSTPSFPSRNTSKTLAYFNSNNNGHNQNSNNESMYIAALASHAAGLDKAKLERISLDSL